MIEARGTAALEILTCLGGTPGMTKFRRRSAIGRRPPAQVRVVGTGPPCPLLMQAAMQLSCIRNPGTQKSAPGAWSAAQNTAIIRGL